MPLLSGSASAAVEALLFHHIWLAHALDQLHQ